MLTTEIIQSSTWGDIIFYINSFNYIIQSDFGSFYFYFWSIKPTQALANHHAIWFHSNHHIPITPQTAPAPRSSWIL